MSVKRNSGTKTLVFDHSQGKTVEARRSPRRESDAPNISIPANGECIGWQFEEWEPGADYYVTDRNDPAYGQPVFTGRGEGKGGVDRFLKRTGQADQGVTYGE